MVLGLQSLKAILETLSFLGVGFYQLAREVVERLAIIGLDHISPLSDCAGTIPRVKKLLAQYKQGIGVFRIDIDSESGNVNSHTLVCPAAESGYEIDPDPAPGFSYGMTDLQHVKKGGDKYWDVSQADKGCIQLYCDGRNGSSHVWISEVQVRERRVNSVTQCHPPIRQDSMILPGELKEITLDLQQAASGCENPQWQSHIEIRDDNGAKLSEKDLALGAPSERALDALQAFTNPVPMPISGGSDLVRLVVWTPYLMSAQQWLS